MKKADFNWSEFIEGEFQRIITYLSLSQVKELFGDGHAGDNNLDVIRAFAEGSIAKNPKQDFREKLRKRLRSTGFKGDLL